jgi:hypothetical protein
MTKRDYVVGTVLMLFNAVVLGYTVGGVHHLKNIGYWPPQILLLLFLISLITAVLIVSAKLVAKNWKQDNYNKMIFWIGVFILFYPTLLFCFQGIAYKLLEVL